MMFDEMPIRDFTKASRGLTSITSASPFWSAALSSATVTKAEREPMLVFRGVIDSRNAECSTNSAPQTSEISSQIATRGGNDEPFGVPGSGVFGPLGGSRSTITEENKISAGEVQEGAGFEANDGSYQVAHSVASTMRSTFRIGQRLSPNR